MLRHSHPLVPTLWLAGREGVVVTRPPPTTTEEATGSKPNQIIQPGLVYQVSPLSKVPSLTSALSPLSLSTAELGDGWFSSTRCDIFSSPDTPPVVTPGTLALSLSPAQSVFSCWEWLTSPLSLCCPPEENYFCIFRSRTKFSVQNVARQRGGSLSGHTETRPVRPARHSVQWFVPRSEMCRTLGPGKTGNCEK